MATIFSADEAIPEGSTRKYTTQLKTLDGTTLLTDAQVSSILFSLRDPRTGAILNSRNQVEVKNANGGTLSATGFFTMLLNASDTVSNGTRRFQERRAIFEVTFYEGTENHEVVFYVQNLADIG